MYQTFTYFFQIINEYFPRKPNIFDGARTQGRSYSVSSYDSTSKLQNVFVVAKRFIV